MCERGARAKFERQSLRGQVAEGCVCVQPEVLRGFVWTVVGTRRDGKRVWCPTVHARGYGVDRDRHTHTHTHTHTHSEDMVWTETCRQTQTRTRTRARAHTHIHRHTELEGMRRTLI